MQQRLHRAVLRGSQFTGQIIVPVPGILIGIEAAVFGLDAWPSCDGRWRDDYGWHRHDRGTPCLSATTDDGTGRLIVAQNGVSLDLWWLFPSSETRGLARGSYDAVASLRSGDERADLSRIRFVID